MHELEHWRTSSRSLWRARSGQSALLGGGEQRGEWLFTVGTVSGKEPITSFSHGDQHSVLWSLMQSVAYKGTEKKTLTLSISTAIHWFFSQSCNTDAMCSFCLPLSFLVADIMWPVPCLPSDFLRSPSCNVFHSTTPALHSLTPLSCFIFLWSTSPLPSYYLPHYSYIICLSPLECANETSYKHPLGK